jgi:hypothetical protein
MDSASDPEEGMESAQAAPQAVRNHERVEAALAVGDALVDASLGDGILEGA